MNPAQDRPERDFSAAACALIVIDVQHDFCDADGAVAATLGVASSTRCAGRLPRCTPPHIAAECRLCSSKRCIVTQPTRGRGATGFPRRS